MSTVEIWTHPSYTKTSAWHYQETNILNTKLLAVGLIDYTGNNTTELNKINTFDLSVVHNQAASEVVMCDLYYQLPNGDGSIKFSDVVGQTYKTIVEESYSSTKCYIRIRPVMARYTTYNPNLPFTSNYWKLNYVVSFSTLPTFIGSEFEIRMHAYSSNSGLPNAIAYTTSITPSFVYNGGDSFHLSFLHTKLPIDMQSLLPTQVNHPHHLMSFTIYRKDGYVYICYHDYTTSLGAINAASAASSFHLINMIVVDKYGIQYKNTDHSTFIQNGLTNYVPTDIDQRRYFTFVYIGQYTKLAMNPAIIKGLSSNGVSISKTLIYYDLVINYRGVNTKMKYIDFGEFYLPFHYSPLTNSTLTRFTEMSYFILFDDHPCKTTTVG